MRSHVGLKSPPDPAGLQSLQLRSAAGMTVQRRCEGVLRQYSRQRANQSRSWTSAFRTMSLRPSGDFDDSIAHRQKLGTAERDLTTSARMVPRPCRSQRPDVGMDDQPLPVRRAARSIADAAADPGPCVFARLYRRERDLWRNVSQDTSDATPSNRQPHILTIPMTGCL